MSYEYLYFCMDWVFENDSRSQVALEQLVFIDFVIYHVSYI